MLSNFKFAEKLLVCCILFFGITSKAQTLTVNNNAPAAGDPVYTIYQIDSTGITQGGLGAGQTWTFALNGLNSPKTYSTVASTTYSYANVAVTSGPNDSSFYALQTANPQIDLNYYGGDNTIGLSQLKIKYNWIYHTYKASYPSFIPQYFSVSGQKGTVTVNVPSTITHTITSGNSLYHPDATGTLILPTQTYTDVIRVARTNTMNAGSGKIIIKEVHYDYYSLSASKAPIFSIHTTTLTSTISGLNSSTSKIVTVQGIGLTSIKEQTNKKIEVLIYPNPATSVVNFSTASLEATKVIVSDITGKIIATEQLEMGKSKMNTNNLTAGLYLYNVVDKNNQTLATGKFNVTR